MLILPSSLFQMQGEEQRTGGGYTSVPTRSS